MKTVLLIEDDPVVTVIYRRYLEANGFSVETAADGAAGLDLFASKHPDAVILDIMMPKVNGLEVLLTIRGDERLGNIPVIVLTAAYVRTIVDEVTKAGANRIFDKSNDQPIALMGYLHDLLGTSVPTAVAVASKGGNPDAFLDYWPARNHGSEATC